MKKITLKWTGYSGDMKRAFIEAKENDGWSDVRLELDTDDCDRKNAERQMRRIIKLVNTHPDNQ